MGRYIYTLPHTSNGIWTLVQVDIQFSYEETTPTFNPISLLSPKFCGVLY